jgi:spore germination cell wall hydrolase CwlJ-like protein
MTFADQFMLSLTMWRENRGGGYDGMLSVANVIMNRAAKRDSTPYEECIRPWQFSSITAKADPELSLYPSLTDPQWKLAQSIALDAAAGKLNDITDGATFYYALSIPEPSWAKSMQKTVEIKNQVFFK